MARKKHEEEHENHERWLVSYADFITLLFAFFTVLYATSQKDISKAREFEQSIRNSFRSFLDFGGIMGGHTAFDDQGKIIPPPIDLHPPMAQGPAEVEDTVRRSIEKDMSKEEIKQVVSDLKHDSVGVQLSLAASSLFPSGSDQFSNEGLGALDKIGPILRATERRLIIEGHTDNLKIASLRFASNWELSSSRATRVVRYLIRQHHIPENRLVAVAYADQKPVATNDTEIGRAKNRRIEIMIVTGDAKF